MGAVRSYVRHGVRSAWSVISRGCGGEGRRRAAEARGARGAACNDDGGSGAVGGAAHDGRRLVAECRLLPYERKK